MWDMVHNARGWRETSQLWEKSFIQNLGTCLKPKWWIWKAIKRWFGKVIQQAKYQIISESERFEGRGGGHVWRVGENLIRNVLIRKPTNQWPRGRPSQRWLDGGGEDVSDTDELMSLDDAMGQNG